MCPSYLRVPLQRTRAMIDNTRCQTSLLTIRYTYTRYPSTEPAPRRVPLRARPPSTPRAPDTSNAPPCHAQVEWLKAIGVQDVPMMLYKHPRVLGSSLDLLREKHAFVVDEWGRKPEEIEIFPQVLTYSLDYLRARAGFLLANGKADQHHLHRILRTADHLFANLSGGRTAQVSGVCSCHRRHLARCRGKRRRRRRRFARQAA